MDIFSTNTTIGMWLWPIFAALVGVAIGYVAEKIVLSYLRGAALKTQWQGDEIIVNAFKNVAFLLFVIMGIYIAARSLGLFSAYINQALIIAIVILATWSMNKMATGFVALYTNKDDPKAASSSIVKHIVQFIVLGLGVLIILQSLGISVTPMLTAAGIGGVAVALGLQSTLANLFTGIQLVASKKIQTGDYIEINSGEKGYVSDITWRYTTIKTFGNNMVIVPNSEMSNAVVKNYSLPGKEISVRVDVSVSYDSDLEKVEEVTLGVAKEVLADSGFEGDFTPVVRFHTFNDSGIDFTVVMRTKDIRDRYVMKHDFIKRLHKRYKEEGIHIPYPTRTVHMHQ